MKFRYGYGYFIKKHRIESGFKSIRQLAERSGISSATISRIEREVQKPEVRTLETLSKHLKSTSC
ncbi:helix-turn-helix transcriptional regulator [Heyndrickxia sporothermodurans]|uniref:helix-turn-helix domain-containing protein n=1 Tax=Heyndrickxia sporothermodurans TaxID=46224 RepID=UPI002DC04034|nr:helix-turn-helix transcriptional regulator [Heyndrickxia sporothermodurans]MEB6550216.1 helix-turn-helix transcriptional regulator [Heyndrickxia sporothermodurans]